MHTFYVSIYVHDLVCLRCQTFNSLVLHSCTHLSCTFSSKNSSAYPYSHLIPEYFDVSVIIIKIFKVRPVKITNGDQEVRYECNQAFPIFGSYIKKRESGRKRGLDYCILHYDIRNYCYI